MTSNIHHSLTQQRQKGIRASLDTNIFALFTSKVIEAPLGSFGIVIKGFEKH